ncbi:TGF-beta receptor type-2 [Fundulus heteroclitus]|uniref:TGF-beta receptor type-2 n=1 Tax=Fundulus heteroclitus TaxID=8078 RepID=UPI00165C8977|nr:TGF-beta receptor type-2 [Fundulus heteroclitus]
MARCWTLWTAILVLVTAGAVHSLGADILCKWCDVSTPKCKDDICFSNCDLTSFCSSNVEVCISIWRKQNDSQTVQTMCHNPELPLDGVDPLLLLNFTSRECHMVPQPAVDGDMMVCGCQGQAECNDKLIFSKGFDGLSKLQSQDVIAVVVISLVPLVLVVIVATAAFYSYRIRRPDWPAKHTPELYQALDVPHDGPAPSDEDGGKNLLALEIEQEDFHNKELSLSNGTVSYRSDWQLGKLLPVKLDQLVGKGRFAEVWRARLLHSKKQEANGYETVAVKVFPSKEYASWRNECSIFSDATLQHDNLVQFLAAEEMGPPGSIHQTYWLVMAYYSLGNLQDFLTANIMSWEELVAMAASIAKGLAHLHSDTTTSGVPKVPVAHRDLKSSNIVVKNRKECALCDFGLALRLDLSLTVDDYANSGQVGTARYMAPEVLESRVNLEDLEAFKQMDVYSMAMVLWEMASRCEVIGEVKSYEPAFGSKVCEQPSVDSMRDLVLRDRGRPDIPPAWTQHQGMDIFCSTITECWDHDPEARLTVHCVVERLNALQQGEEW